MKTLKTILIVLLILVLIPIGSWVVWNFKSSRPLDILVMDKTVLDLEKKAHRSIFWVLLNEKFVKNNKKAYRMQKDYYGFHPVKPLKSREYEVKRIKLEEIESLSSEYDAAYYSDTYGVFFNEWYRRSTAQGKGTLIEGGLNNNDYLFIRNMHDAGKLILAEYNFLAPPTIGLVKKKTEDLLGIKWTNWTGTYIRNLDPKRSKDLPDWVVNIYKKRHGGEWPFSGSGIIFVNEPAQHVVVLEAEKHLDSAVPDIQTTEYGMQSYEVPETVHYPYWFDIMDEKNNHVIAEYKVHINLEGKAVLDEYNLSSRFPAIIASSQGAPFYYLAGDYSGYPVGIWTAKLQGIRTFESLFYSEKEHSAAKFYWTYYVPLISQILSDYQASLEE
jgi:hypothetical protein